MGCLPVLGQNRKLTCFCTCLLHPVCLLRWLACLQNWFWFWETCSSELDRVDPDENEDPTKVEAGSATRCSGAVKRVVWLCANLLQNTDLVLNLFQELVLRILVTPHLTRSDNIHARKKHISFNYCQSWTLGQL